MGKCGKWGVLRSHVWGSQQYCRADLRTLRTVTLCRCFERPSYTRPASSRGIWWCSRWLWASRGQCQEGREVPQHWSTWSRQRLATRTRVEISLHSTAEGKTNLGVSFGCNMSTDFLQRAGTHNLNSKQVLQKVLLAVSLHLSWQQNHQGLFMAIRQSLS